MGQGTPLLSLFMIFFTSQGSTQLYHDVSAMFDKILNAIELYHIVRVCREFKSVLNNTTHVAVKSITEPMRGIK